MIDIYRRSVVDDQKYLCSHTQDVVDDQKYLVQRKLQRRMEDL